MTEDQAQRRVEWFECTLVACPQGGWYVAPYSPIGGAFPGSLTWRVDTLEEAVARADQIDRKRTGRY